MKLLASLASPYARKVRIVLAEKKIDYQLELVDVWAADTAIGQSNPLGKVPTLIMDDGGAVFDSRVIVEYLDGISPVHRLIPQNGRERVEVRCWEALADGLLDAAVLMRLEETQRPPELRSAAWVERQRQKVTTALTAMANGLGDKAWCNGHGYTLADIAVGCALNWLAFRFPAIDWRTAHTNLAALVDKLNQRSSFVETQPRV